MKILKDDKVYVQKNDMVYLNSSDLSIPASIFMKVFGQGVTIIDHSNRYEFIEFTKPEDVEFFKNLDWIVDYESVKDLSEDEIIALGQAVAAERNERAKKFNALPDSARRQQYNAVLADLELLDFKMNSLRDIIMFKRGELDFSLPEGVALPKEVIDAVEEETSLTEKQQKETGIKSLLKSIFRRKKQ